MNCVDKAFSVVGLIAVVMAHRAHKDFQRDNNILLQQVLASTEELLRLQRNLWAHMVTISETNGMMDKGEHCNRLGVYRTMSYGPPLVSH
jgi:hypothetical protein